MTRDQRRNDELVTLREWGQATARAYTIASREWRYRAGFPQAAARGAPAGFFPPSTGADEPAAVPPKEAELHVE